MQQHQEVIWQLQQELETLARRSTSMQQELAEKAASAVELSQQLQQCNAQLTEAQQQEAKLLQRHDDQKQLLDQEAFQVKHLTTQNQRLGSETLRLGAQLGQALSYRTLCIQQQRELQSLTDIISGSAQEVQQLREAQQQSSTGHEASWDHVALGLASMVPPAVDAGGFSEASEQLRSLLRSCQEIMLQQHTTLTQVRCEREHFKSLFVKSKRLTRKWEAACHRQRSSSRGMPSTTCDSIQQSLHQAASVSAHVKCQTGGCVWRYK